MFRIFLIDSHPLLRLGLRTLFAGQPDMEVCGETEVAREALAFLSELRPDLVVADIALPGMSGLELIRELQALCPQLPVMVFSDHDEALYAERVIKAGGRGFVPKSAAEDVVLDAVRQITSGRIYLTRAMTDRLLRSMAVGGRNGNSHLEVLSDRELEVFELIGRGKGTHDIADLLCISIHTVETHRTNAREKLQLPNVADLIRHAVMWVESGVNHSDQLNGS